MPHEYNHCHHDEHSCSCQSHEHHDHHDHCHDGCSDCHNHCHDDVCSCHHSNKPISKRLFTLIPSAVILGISFLIPENYFIVSMSLLILAYILVGFDTVISAIKALVKERSVDEAFLMTVATVGAIAIGELKEAVAVMVFYSVGQILEEVAQNRSKKSIRALMDLHPDVVTVKRDNELIKVEPESVKVGETVVVLPGERFALDGVIIKGNTSIDYSALTGESVPVASNVGDVVYGGGINIFSAVELEATKEYSQSASARIIALVEDARSKKAKSERFISKFSRKYTLAVCLAALIITFVFPIFTGYAETFTRWLYSGLTFLVVSCPCALVISVPLTFFAGLGCASTQGILIKATASIETLSKLKSVAMDKTGTVTKGSLVLTNTTITGDAYNLVAHAEAHSTHPVAKAFVSASNPPVNKYTVESVTEIPGMGISAVVDGKAVLAGNAVFMQESGITPAAALGNGAVIHSSIDGEYVGYALFEDEIKADSQFAVSHMNKLGVNRVVMLTGDNPKNASSVCDKVGISEVYSSLSPEGKCNKLEEIKSQTQNGYTAFVGDGINDAPVLAMADIGVAMGGLGSDSAIETADVVILDDSLSKLPVAVKLARRTMSIVWQNIIFALGAKAVVMILSLFNITNMWLAVFADIGVMLIAVLNALRALKYRR